MANRHTIPNVGAINRSHPLATGLVAWWHPLPNLIGGARWFDIAGNNIAAFVGNTLWDRGYLTFDGTGDYLTVSDLGPLNLVGDFTISARFMRTGAAADRYIISKQKTTASYNGYGLYAGSAGVIRLETSDGTLTTLIGTTVISSDVWYHVVATRTGGAGALYLNGVAESTTGSVRSGDTTFAVGARIGDFTGGAAAWRGGIGEVSIRRTCLNAAQVKQLYVESLQGYPTLLNRIPQRRNITQQAGAATGNPWNYYAQAC
jgi:hypothetical protein